MINTLLKDSFFVASTSALDNKHKAEGMQLKASCHLCVCVYILFAHTVPYTHTCTHECDCVCDYIYISHLYSVTVRACGRDVCVGFYAGAYLTKCKHICVCVCLYAVGWAERA